MTTPTTVLFFRILFSNSASILNTETLAFVSAKTTLQLIVLNICTKQCYNAKMQDFCDKTVHSSVNLLNFHLKLSDAGITNFKNACMFQDNSGIDVSKFTAELRTTFDNLVEEFVRVNSSKVQKPCSVKPTTITTTVKVNDNAQESDLSNETGKRSLLAAAIPRAQIGYKEIMTDKLAGKTISESELKHCHDDALVFILFKLDIKQIVDNCDEEIKTLREYLCNTAFVEFQEKNASLRRREADKIADQERQRLHELERVRRREDIQRQAKENERRQEAVERQNSDKRNSAGNKVGTPDRVNSAISYYREFQDHRQAEEKKRRHSKELAEKKRLQELEEFRRREIEDKRQAEEKKRRQEAAFLQNSDKRYSAGNNVGTPHRVKSAISYSPAAPGFVTKIDSEALAPAIAIELGLKFIRVGYMDKDGSQIVPLEDSVEEMPCIIGVDKDEIIFGTAAQLGDQPIPLEKLVTEMNAALTVPLILEGKEVEFRLEELTALLLIHVKQKCEAFLRLTIPIQEAVIIIPAWYNHELRLGTKHAAELAGFTRNRLISEPSAVALGWWWKNKSMFPGAKAASSTKVIVGVASNFSFDAAGFEIDNNTVQMKTIVNKLNISLGVRNTAKKKVYGLANYFSNVLELDPEELQTNQIISKAFLFWTSTRQADYCIFLETPGYKGRLNCTSFNEFCKGSNNITTSRLSLIGGTVYTVDSEARSRAGGRLKEVQTYSLTWEDWTQGTGKICETGTLLSGVRRFDVDLKIGILPTTRINVKVFEKVDGHEREIAKVHVDSAMWASECKSFKLNFCVNTEGILSAEAKFGVDEAQVSIDSNNLKTLNASREKIERLLAMGSVKAYQEAIENLMSIERSLRAHIKDSKKILEILKTPIVKEIDKIMALVDDRSSLADVEDAIKKLTKYSEKYLKN